VSRAKKLIEKMTQLQTVVDTPNNRNKKTPWDVAKGPKEEEPTVDKFTKGKI
jgi:hypothetical protein